MTSGQHLPRLLRSLVELLLNDPDDRGGGQAGDAESDTGSEAIVASSMALSSHSSKQSAVHAWQALLRDRRLAGRSGGKRAILRRHSSTPSEDRANAGEPGHAAHGDVDVSGFIDAEGPDAMLWYSSPGDIAMKQLPSGDVIKSDPDWQDVGGIRRWHVHDGLTYWQSEELALSSSGL